MQKLYHILCIKAMFVDVCEPDLEVRLLLLHFQLGIELQNIESANEMLSEIEAIFSSNSIEEIHLPNQFYCTKIDARVISNEKNLIDCLIFQKNVHLLYSSDEFPFEKFHEIEKYILKCRQQHFEGKLLTTLDQIEILIEGYWMTDRLIECFRWCEIGLHHAIDTYWTYKTNKKLIPERHLQHIRFVWIYIQHLWKSNSCEFFFINPLKMDFFLFHKPQSIENVDNRKGVILKSLLVRFICVKGHYFFLRHFSYDIL